MATIRPTLLALVPLLLMIFGPAIVGCSASDRYRTRQTARDTERTADTADRVADTVDSDSGDDSDDGDDSSSSSSSSSDSSSDSSSSSTSSNDADSGAHMFRSREAGLAITVPNGWHVETERNDYLAVASPNKYFRAGFLIAGSGTFQEVLDRLNVHVDNVLTRSQFTAEAEPGNEIAGLATMRRAGTATYNGRDVRFTVAVIRAEVPVILVGFCDADAWEEHNGRLRQFVDAIRSR